MLKLLTLVTIAGCLLSQAPVVLGECTIYDMAITDAQGTTLLTFSPYAYSFEVDYKDFISCDINIRPTTPLEWCADYISNFWDDRPMRCVVGPQYFAFDKAETPSLGEHSLRGSTWSPIQYESCHSECENEPICTCCAGGGGMNADFRFTYDGSTDHILGFALMEPDTNTELKMLTDEDSVCGDNMNIVVKTPPCANLLEKVEFYLKDLEADQIVRTHTESKAPYAFFGDDGRGDIFRGDIAPGRYELTAFAVFKDGSGMEEASVLFEVTDAECIGDECPTDFILGFAVIDPDTEADIGPLVGGATICGENLNIVASTPTICDHLLERVTFSLTDTESSQVVASRTEAKFPYALFGDKAAGDFFGGSIPPGDYELTATAYFDGGSELTSVSFQADECRRHLRST